MYVLLLYRQRQQNEIIGTLRVMWNYRAHVENKTTRKRCSFLLERAQRPSRRRRTVITYHRVTCSTSEATIGRRCPRQLYRRIQPEIEDPRGILFVIPAAVAANYEEREREGERRTVPVGLSLSSWHDFGFRRDSSLNRQRPQHPGVVSLSFPLLLPLPLDEKPFAGLSNRRSGSRRS